MKTSKKLLSFFLAVVMVITSCSVGLTAFAADNKTDTNNAYWNDGTDADAAFSALNDLIATYIPQLLNVPAIKNALESSLGMTITDKTGIPDLIAGLSPTLLGALGSGTANKKDIIPNYTNLSELYYSYLDGTDKDKIDFYTLYQFCKTNKGSSNKELREYASETFEKLDALLGVYEKTNSSVDAKLEASEYKLAEYTLYLPENFMSLSLHEYENLDVNGTKMKDVKDADVDYYIEYLNGRFKAMGSDIVVDNIAAAIYYYLDVIFEENVNTAEKSLYLINLGGGTVTDKALGGKGDKLTIENYREKVGALYTFADYCKDNNYTDEALENAETKAIAESNYDRELSIKLYSCIFDEENKNYAAFSSTNYDAMCTGILAYSGIYGTAEETQKYVEDAKITDDQLKAAMQYAKDNNWVKDEKLLTAYLNDDSVCAFSKPARTFLKAMISSYNTQMVQFTGLFAQDSLDDLKSFKLTNTLTNVKGLSLIDLTNYMVSSEIAIDTLGKGYEIQGAIETTQPVMFYDILNKYNELVLPAIKEQNKVYKYSDYAIPDSVMVEAVNSLLNSYVTKYLNPEDDIGEIITGIVGDLLETEVDLQALATDLWKNLYNQPVETVFNLLPTLVILIDELIEPLIFNGEGDKYNGDANMIKYVLCDSGLLELLGVDIDFNQFTQEAGDTEIGIGSFDVDLNKTLPAILHWLTGDTEGTYEIVGSYTGDIYNNDIPKFLNIYVADKALYGASLGKSFQRLLVKNGMSEDAAKGVDEIVTELATFAMNSIDKYVAEHGNDIRYSSDYDTVGSQIVPISSNKGLNNILLALPQVIDQMGKDFIKKYKVDSDWTYCYSGKIGTVTKLIGGSKEVTQYQNNTLQDFKDLAIKNDSTAVLNNFIDILIGNWFNGLLDFLNDIIQDENNKITSAIPLVSGLLNALGGFGETSIITDLVNGLFQLKRSDDASFTLTKRQGTGFVGFSNKTGFFLISNIQFNKNGQQRGLVPFITQLIKADTKADYNVSNAMKASVNNSPLLANSKKSDAGTDYSKLLTKENTKAAQELVDTLDKLLSSLLENTSLNGFDWDATDNILASLVTFASGYLGAKNTNDIVKLLNNYLYFISSEYKGWISRNGKMGSNLPTKDGDVDDKKVYTSSNLSNLVIQTYSLVENIIDYLFYNSSNGLLAKNDPNMLIADAVYGIISPDAVAVRMSKKYSKTANILKSKNYQNWTDFRAEIIEANNTKGTWTKDYLKYGFSKGDKKAFYNALGESLSGITAIFGVVLTKSYTDTKKSGNYYSEILYPILNSLAKVHNVKSVMTPAKFNKASNTNKLINGIFTPISDILAKFYSAPASHLLNTIKGIAGVLNDKSIKSIVNGAIAPLNNEINGVVTIVKFLSPTLAKIISKAIGGGIKVTLPKKNIVVTLINNILGSLSKILGVSITLPNINWNKLATAKSPAEVLLLIYGYVVDTVLNLPILAELIDSLVPGLTKIFKSLSAAQILTTLNQVLSVVQSPTEVFWTFSEYSAKLSNNFSYPKGITASDASKAIGQLDDLVANLFPLLQGFGVDIDGLAGLVNDKLYTNEILTKLTTALYSALSKNDTVTTVLDTLGIDVSPKGIANYLTDKSYGKTYSSAAATLKKAKNWKSVKSLNWGYTDGSSKAKTGFVNAFAAILRPFNDIASILLAENGEVDLGALNVEKLVKTLATKGSTTLGEGEYGCKITYSLKNGIFKLTVQSNVKNAMNKPNFVNVFEIDVAAISKDIDALLNGKKLEFGTNGYENAVIPILEAFMCDGIKTYSQYKKDYKKSKDNLIINILNPIVNFVDDVCDKPFDTISKALPNVAYFIDNGGLTQAVGNLLAPVTAENGLLGILKKNGLDVNELIKAIAGKDLGSIVTEKLGLKKKLKLDLTNLKACNIQDLVLPLVNKLLKSKKIDLTIPEFTFAAIASHGTVQTVASKAKNDQGKYTTKQVKTNQGEVLIAVLRYISEVLIKDNKQLSKLICGIDKVKKNKTIVNVIQCVFTQIGTAVKDDIVRAVFYFLLENTTNTFFDYTNFTYKDDYKFTFGNMDEDFCRKLAPMLDGLVSGLLEGGLTSLVEKNLYKDELVSKLATALYSAIDGVKINDNLNLTQLLAMTDIDFSTSNVAALLTNEDYGKTYPDAANIIKSAGSWKNVKAESLKWGVKDRDTFMNALCAVLRPIYGVLDVLLNDASLNLFNLVKVPGSDGYSSTIVPLLEAFGVYNVKTQYQYREDIFEAYDSILLDIINPLWDKVEDILNAPIETLADILPNLSLFFANDGLLQIVDNLLTPISALLKALEPIVDVNKLLKEVGIDIPKELAKLGINVDIDFDIYDLPATLSPLVGADNVVGFLNNVLGIIKIKGASLGIELPAIDWFQLASHGDVILNGTSQAATYGKRISVKSDQDETLIAVLRYLINTVNYKGNYDAIVNLIGGLIGGADDSVSSMISEVLTMLKGDADTVIENLVDLLQTLGG